MHAGVLAPLPGRPLPGGTRLWNVGIGHPAGAAVSRGEPCSGTFGPLT